MLREWILQVLITRKTFVTRYGDVKIEKWEGERRGVSGERRARQSKINEPAVNHPNEKLWS